MMLESIRQEIKKRPVGIKKIRYRLYLSSLFLGIRRGLQKIPLLFLGFGIFLTLGVMEAGIPSTSFWATRVEMPEDSELSSFYLEHFAGPIGSLQESRPPVNPPNREEFPELTLKTHLLNKGETLSEVAKKYGIRLDTLISMNGITDARRVLSGTELIIPNRDGISYTVQRGDSLSKISARYNIPVRNLVDANDLGTEVIHPGMKLFVPGARMPEMEMRRILGSLFLFPTQGRITSGFGVRSDPFTGVKRFHNGIDIANDFGTTIHAALTGKVAKIGFHPTYGRYIIVTHDGGYQTFYAHLQSIQVSEGRKVGQGEVIGEMGNTGYSTGPHLHFSVFKNGNPVDPMQFFR
ncbi:MAG: M23 family metallopeptidase [Spirochaetales bacterium]